MVRQVRVCVCDYTYVCVSSLKRLIPSYLCSEKDIKIQGLSQSSKIPLAQDLLFCLFSKQTKINIIRAGCILFVESAIEYITTKETVDK